MNFGAAFVALIAAGLWWRASSVVVRPLEKVDAAGWTEEQITVTTEKIGSFDSFETQIKQSQINKWAAIAASLAALLQGVALLMPD